MSIVVRALALAHAAASTLLAQDSALPLEAAPWTCGSAADLDGDGDLDLLLGGEDRPLALLVNDGKGTFTAAAAFATAEARVRALALLDADGDGDLDVLVGALNSLTRLWLNEGSLRFSDGSARLPEARVTVTAIATGDLDGDGDQDAVLGCFGSGCLLFRNEGKRFVTADGALPDVRDVTALVLADLDGDQDLDLVFGQRPNMTGSGGRNRAARNGGAGKFSDATEAWMPSATDHTLALGIADLEGNGGLYLVCANRGAKAKEAARSTLHRRDKAGQFLAHVPRRYGGVPAVSQALALGDVDGDGDIDIVLGNDGPEALYLNELAGKATFSASSAVPRHDDDTRAVLLADLDGDGNRDLVTVNHGAPARWFRNAGAGQFGGTAARAPQGMANGEALPRAAALAGAVAHKYASRAQGRAAVSEREPRDAINKALLFLADRQADDGAFPVATFVGGDFGDAAVPSRHDVGVTALALLCFLAEGSHAREGYYAQSVADGLAWLLRQQAASGLFGPGDAQHGIYDHALATLALAEACVLGNDAALLPPLQKALAEIERRRNPDGGFRYEPGKTPSDSSVTTWCTLALIAGEDAGVAMAPGTPARTVAFLQGLTDAVTGRTGYDERGGLSARNPGEDGVRFPAAASEAMTGAALAVRIALGDDPAQQADMRSGLARLAAALPKAKDEGGYFDPYAWMHMAHALSQLGGDEWVQWRKALHRALVTRQRSSGKLAGSWDPDEPWGSAGGRFASTALATLALQAEYRFARRVDPKWRQHGK